MPSLYSWPWLDPFEANWPWKTKAQIERLSPPFPASLPLRKRKIRTRFEHPGTLFMP